jgi:hypothetical protein
VHCVFLPDVSGTLIKIITVCVLTSGLSSAGLHK